MLCCKKAVATEPVPVRNLTPLESSLAGQTLARRRRGSGHTRVTLYVRTLNTTWRSINGPRNSWTSYHKYVIRVWPDPVYTSSVRGSGPRD